MFLQVSMRIFEHKQSQYKKSQEEEYTSKFLSTYIDYGVFKLSLKSIIYLQF